jgi:hypothetical protein
MAQLIDKHGNTATVGEWIQAVNLLMAYLTLHPHPGYDPEIVHGIEDMIRNCKGEAPWASDFQRHKPAFARKVFLKPSQYPVDKAPIERTLIARPGDDAGPSQPEDTPDAVDVSAPFEGELSEYEFSDQVTRPDTDEYEGEDTRAQRRSKRAEMQRHAEARRKRIAAARGKEITRPESSGEDGDDDTDDEDDMSSSDDSSTSVNGEETVHGLADADLGYSSDREQDWRRFIGPRKMWTLSRPVLDETAVLPTYGSKSAYQIIKPLQARLVGYEDLNDILPGGLPYVGWARNLQRRSQQHVGASPGGNKLMLLLQGCLNYAVGYRKYRLVIVRVMVVRGTASRMPPR